MPDHAMTLRLDEATYQRLRKEAYEQVTTLTDIVRGAIAAQFREWDRDDSGPWPVSRAAAKEWISAPDGEEFRVGECQGHAQCPVETHEHGCFADVGNCNHPDEHQPTDGEPS